MELLAFHQHFYVAIIKKKMFKYANILIAFLLLNLYTKSQEQPQSTLLENIESQNQLIEEFSNDDESLFNLLLQYKKNPLNVNEITREDLAVLFFLNPIQIDDFIKYRNLMGSFISLYELQSIPSWDANTIELVKEIFFLPQNKISYKKINEAFTDGDFYFINCLEQTINSKNANQSDSIHSFNVKSFNPFHFFIKYEYRFKNYMEYGLRADKDAGESFFNGAQKNGFDFYSAHFFLKPNRFLKSLAIGDFLINMGQGLCHWQSYSLSKSADVLSIKKQMPVLNPYHSIGENNFHRGIGVSLSKYNYGLSFFISQNKLDANFTNDTSVNESNQISSILTSGLHRTASEINRKHNEKLFQFGCVVSKQFKTAQIAFNFIHSKFQHEFVKGENPSQLYNSYDKTIQNCSVSYEYTFLNIHFFGETALSKNYSMASINGALISLDKKIDLSLLCRNVSNTYKAYQSNIFGQTNPIGFDGNYIGLQYKPNKVLQTNLYIDLYKFRWLKYGVNKPSSGADYLIQLFYKPTKKSEFNFRYSQKSINEWTSTQINSNNKLPVQTIWRLLLKHNFSKQLIFTSQLEINNVVTNNYKKDNGFLMATALKCSIKNPSIILKAGAFIFETTAFDSRIYFNESDVFNDFFTEFFYEKGKRIFLISQFNISKKSAFDIKFSSTVIPSKYQSVKDYNNSEPNYNTTLKCKLTFFF